jgi:hypothetical protein
MNGSLHHGAYVLNRLRPRSGAPRSGGSPPLRNVEVLVLSAFKSWLKKRVSETVSLATNDRRSASVVSICLRFENLIVFFSTVIILSLGFSLVDRATRRITGHFITARIV